MPTGSKIATIVLVVLLGAAGIYYLATAPSTTSSKSSATKDVASSTQATQTPASAGPPTLTLVPATGGATGGATATPAGSSASPNTTPTPAPLGTPAVAGAQRTQPPFNGATSTPAGTGKGDVAFNPNPQTAAPTNGIAANGVVGGASTATTSSTGTVSSPNTAPRFVNGLPRSTGDAGSVGAGGSSMPASTVATNTGSQNFPQGASTPAGFTPGATSGGPTPTGANLPNRSTTSSTPASSSEVVHVIAANDTFEGLAAKYYGSRKLWKAIAKANPLVEPDSLKIGQKIRIPASPTQLAASEGVNTATPATGASSGSTSGATAAPAGSAVHVVAKGENPSSISRKYYGSDKYWRQILAANKGATEKNLKVGQKLVIPAKSVVAGAENVGSSAN